MMFVITDAVDVVPGCGLVASHATAAVLVGSDSLFMKSSTKDKIQGGINEAKGKAKEETGKAIGNPNLRDRGAAEKAGGKIQRKVGDVKKVFGQ